MEGSQWPQAVCSHGTPTRSPFLTWRSPVPRRPLNPRHWARERKAAGASASRREEAKRAATAAAKESDARAQAEQRAALVFKHLSEEVANVRAGAEEDKQAALARVQEVQALHQREMEAHDATRTLLKQALSAAEPLKATATAKPSRKQPKTADLRTL